MCDIRICSETATFAESFVRVGIVPGDGGACCCRVRCGHGQGCRDGFTGEAISARRRWPVAW